MSADPANPSPALPAADLPLSGPPAIPDLRLDPDASPGETSAGPPPFSTSAQVDASTDASAIEPSIPTPVKTHAQRIIERRERVEKEFREVKSIGAFYAALLLPLLVIVGWIRHFGGDLVAAELWGGAVFYTTILLSAWMWRHELAGKFCWPRAAGKRMWAVVALTPIATVGSATLSLYVAEQVGWPVLDCTDGFVGVWPLWSIYAWTAILPAFFEEIAFRGLLFAKLQRVMTVAQATWVSAILFGIVHFSVMGLAVFLVPLALVAAWLTRRTHSLWPAMIIHFVHNAAIVTLELVAT
jgi:membrane protease YdiL (CAAX protease family)